MAAKVVKQSARSHEYDFKDQVLELRDISLRLGDKQILRDINFQLLDVVRNQQSLTPSEPSIQTGQKIAILGPSGVGKTKLFEIISGLIQPTTGAVLLNKEGVPVRRGEVGVVFQRYPLFNHRTVKGNLVVAGMQKARRQFNERRKKLPAWQRYNPFASIAGFIDGYRTANSRAMELLEAFRLTERARFYPAQLSGGQRQRVAIAQQMISSHQFLLMDEPFSGLDPNAVDDACRLIAKATDADDLNTTIMTTHDVTAAVSVADIILLMGWERDQQGGLIDGATIIEVYDLMALGLAWREGIATTPECSDLVREIKARFHEMRR